MTRRSWTMGWSLGVIACSIAAGDVYDVTLDGLSFVYNGQTNMNIDLTINTGDTVRWTWVSGFHNVVSGFTDDPNPGALFMSGAPTGAAGTVFEYTFMDTGLYGYHCEVHESLGMVSSVNVVPAPASLGLIAPAGMLALRRRR